MNRQEALTEFFTQVERWFPKPVLYESPVDGKVRIYFNNEYGIDLPLEVVKVLWPDSREEEIADT